MADLAAPQPKNERLIKHDATKYGSYLDVPCLLAFRHREQNLDPQSEFEAGRAQPREITTGL